MKVVLLEKQQMGDLGDIVNVKPGYARNFLFPQSKALPANAANIAKFEAQRAELEAKQAEILKAAQARAAALQDKVVTIVALSSEEGKLFGSIGTRDIAHALAELGLVVENKEVLLPEGTLREVGEYPVKLQLHTDVQAQVLVHIKADS